ncbi:MAG: hypothetical protein ABSD13_03265 [Candidatus Korobacteraceae bacterium]|jgi:mannose-6-phosphate isomerase-like protein (cupin superfamily)
MEEIYFVLSGGYRFGHQNEKIALEATDSTPIGAGGGRLIINESNMPAIMLGIVN